MTKVNQLNASFENRCGTIHCALHDAAARGVTNCSMAISQTLPLGAEYGLAT